MSLKKMLAVALSFSLISTSFVFSSYASVDDAANDNLEIPSYIQIEKIGDVDYLQFDAAEDVEWLRQHVLSGGDSSGYCTHNIIMKNDISMSDSEFNDKNGADVGIGVPQSWYGYSGIFDGDGHILSGINLTNTSEVGPKGLLFNLTKDATIKNVAVKGELTSTRYMGGLIGRTLGSLNIQNCVVNGKLILNNGNSNAIGGLIGQVGSGQTTGGENINIENSVVIGSFTSNTSTNPVGGLVGHIYGGFNVSISNSYCAAELECSGGDVAGIVGSQGSKTFKVKNCYYSDNIKNSLFVMTGARADEGAVGPDSSLVDAHEKNDEYMKTADFVNDLGSGIFKEDNAGVIADGYPVPNTIGLIDVVVKSISWDIPDDIKTSYYEGETFDKSGIKAYAELEDGSTVDITDSISFKSGPLRWNDSSVNITARYGKASESKDISISVVPLKTLKVDTSVFEEKASLIEGLYFRDSYLKVWAVYTDGYERLIKDETPTLDQFTMDGYSCSLNKDSILTTDMSSVTIKYLNAAVSFPITVKERSILSEKFASPYSLLYMKGEKVDIKGMSWTLITNVGSVSLHEATNDTNENPDNTFTYKVDGNTINFYHNEHGKIYTHSVEFTRLESEVPDCIDNVYQLKTVDDLVWFSNQVNRGNVDINAILLNDINLSDLESNAKYFTPIAYRCPDMNAAYKGSFDGNNHTVTLKLNIDKTYNRDGSRNTSILPGFFGICDGAAIKNLTVAGSITINTSVGGAGGIVASAENTVIENCINKADISITVTNAETKSFGGILGVANPSKNNPSKIINCVNYGNIKGTDFAKNKKADTVCGGIVGTLYDASVTNCYNMGNVSSRGTAGGVFGLINTESNRIGQGTKTINISNIYNAGVVSGTDGVSKMGTFAGEIKSENNTININNVAYQKQDNVSGYPESYTPNEQSGNIEEKTMEELKSSEIIKVISDSFTLGHSEAAGNEGYPVLKWQVESLHTWDEGTVTKEATTEEEGEKTYKCTDPTCDVTKTEPIAKLEKPSSGGSSSGGSGGTDSTVQKPTVKAGEGGKVSLSADGTSLTITPDAGYEISKVTVNGTDKGSVSSLTGLKTGDKISVEFAKKSESGDKAVYKDVEDSDWFNEAVNYVTVKGLMSGTGHSLFSPNADTTRGMLMTILARMSGVDTSDSTPWYQKGLDWAVTQGVSDGTAPEKIITREQLATMLYRYAGSPETTGKVNRFNDADQVSDYALNAVKWAVEKGIISGNGDAVTLDPKGHATRAQMATMMMRYCELAA